MGSSIPGEPSHLDQVIAAYKSGLDRTLLRENLEKTPTERLQTLVAMQRLADEVRRAGARAFAPR